MVTLEKKGQVQASPDVTLEGVKARRGEVVNSQRDPVWAQAHVQVAPRSRGLCVCRHLVAKEETRSGPQGPPGCPQSPGVGGGWKQGRPVPDLSSPLTRSSVPSLAPILPPPPQ